MTRKDNKQATDLDKEVGIKIENIRISRGLSRHQLADEIGITHQQLQKYEKGINRMSLGRFSEICKMLNVSINDLLNEDVIDDNLEDKRLNIELMREFNKLNRKQKHNFVDFIRSVNCD